MKHIILRLTPLEATVLALRAERNDPDENFEDPILSAALRRVFRKMQKARVFASQKDLDYQEKL